MGLCCSFLFFFSSRRRHTIWPRDWSSDVCSSDLFLFFDFLVFFLIHRLRRHGFKAHHFRIGSAHLQPGSKIGRASCRERVEISVGGVSLKRKREEQTRSKK